MRLFFVILISALALAAAGPQNARKQAPAKKASAQTEGQTQAAKAAPSSAVPNNAAPSTTDPSKLTIPEGAVKNAEGDSLYTDSQGKKWIYRVTPFGVVRMEDTPERTAAKNDAANGVGIKATEDGNVVHFERKGPFGLWKWDKKKSEMDDAEKAALQRAQTESKTTSKQD